MRSNLIAATAVSILLAACGGGHDLESLGPPPEASPTGNAGIEDVNGSIVVDAQGTFSASE